MKRPGEPARLYVDAVRALHADDYIRTPSGRTYLITAVRVQQRGKHAGRQHLSTVVMAPGHEPEADAFVLTIRWHRRRRKETR